MRKNILIVTLFIAALGSGVAMAGGSKGGNRGNEQGSGWTAGSAPKVVDSNVLQKRDREREQEQLRLEQHDGPKPMEGSHEPVKTRTQDRKRLQDGTLSEP